MTPKSRVEVETYVLETLEVEELIRNALMQLIFLDGTAGTAQDVEFDIEFTDMGAEVRVEVTTKKEVVF